MIAGKAFMSIHALEQSAPAANPSHVASRAVERYPTSLTVPVQLRPRAADPPQLTRRSSLKIPDAEFPLGLTWRIMELEMEAIRNETY
jgi:hypothetical protein